MAPSRINTTTTKALILAILSKRTESYGYEIIQLVAQLSDGAFQWKDGMLYPVLHGMQKDKLIRSKWRVAENGRRRKYYSITDRGLVVLGEMKTHWELVNSTMTKAWNLKLRLT